MPHRLPGDTDPRPIRRLQRVRHATVLTAAATLLLTACGGGGTGPAGSDLELSEDEVTLRFTWWGGDERHQRTEEVIELFEEEHPNITVQGEFRDWSGYWDSLATTVAANDAPDIIQMDELYLASYAERGALLDLDTADEFIDTSDFDDNTLATGVVDESLYALPVGVGAFAMVANLDLLDEYGIDLPDDETWSWDDLMEISAEITEASDGDVDGLSSWGFHTGELHIWARQAGENLYDEDGNVAVSPETMADFWSYLAEIADGDAAPSPSVTIERATGGLDESGTATNATVFELWWNTQLTEVTATSGSELQLLKMPGEADAVSPGPYYKSSMYWSISARSEHPAEAALFVDFLANNEDAADILLTERGIPANERIRSEISDELADTDTEAAEYLDAITVAEPPRVTPTGASDIEEIVARHTEQVLFGEVTPDEAAESFIAELQAEIDAA